MSATKFLLNVTSLVVSKRLSVAGFKLKGDTVTWEPGVNFQDPGEQFWRYRADTLEQWLFTKGSEMLVSKTVDEGFSVNWGINFFMSHGASLPDAYAEIIIKYLEWQKITKNEGVPQGFPVIKEKL